MNKKRKLRTAATLALCLAAALSGTSCVTTYDAAGRPVQTVDPGVAVAGAAAAGVLGYAIARDRHHHHGYYGPYPYHCY